MNDEAKPPKSILEHGDLWAKRIVHYVSAAGIILAGLYSVLPYHRVALGAVWLALAAVSFFGYRKGFRLVFSKKWKVLCFAALFLSCKFSLDAFRTMVPAIAAGEEPFWQSELALAFYTTAILLWLAHLVYALSYPLEKIAQRAGFEVIVLNEIYDTLLTSSSFTGQVHQKMPDTEIAQSYVRLVTKLDSLGELIDSLPVGDGLLEGPMSDEFEQLVIRLGKKRQAFKAMMKDVQTTGAESSLTSKGGTVPQASTTTAGNGSTPQASA